MYKTGVIGKQEKREEVVFKKKISINTQQKVTVFAHPKKKVSRCDLGCILNSQQFKDLICSITRECPQPIKMPNCILPPKCIGINC